jgi:hypothetical protein
MSTTWKILIDWDRDGDFDDTYDDVTSRVLQAKWYLGSSRAYAENQSGKVGLLSKM